MSSISMLYTSPAYAIAPASFVQFVTVLGDVVENNTSALANPCFVSLQGLWLCSCFSSSYNSNSKADISADLR